MSLAFIFFFFASLQAWIWQLRPIDALSEARHPFYNNDPTLLYQGSLVYSPSAFFFPQGENHYISWVLLLWSFKVGPFSWIFGS